MSKDGITENAMNVRMTGGTRRRSPSSNGGQKIITPYRNGRMKAPRSR